jgi:hypothetical protein
MARIAKAEVHAALRFAADSLIAAGGPDKRVSRADVEQKLETLDGIPRALTDLFFRFIDNRDYEKGAVVTVTDVREGYLYAIENLIDPFDVNNNGFSEAEVAKMSTIGKLAVALAAEYDDNWDQPVFVSDFNQGYVEAKLAELTEELRWLSESDAGLEPIVVPLAPYADLDVETVQRLFADVHGELAREVLDDEVVEVFDLAEAHGEERGFGEWFVHRRMPDDLEDPLAVERAVRIGELVDYMTANVAEPRVFAYSDRVTPEGQPTGAVSVFVLGRSPTGWLLGVFTVSVET